jgi:ABC-2 type transport system ATP-binding protein
MGRAFASSLMAGAAERFGLPSNLYLRVEVRLYLRLDASESWKAQPWAMSEIDVVRVRGLFKRYGRRLVVDGLDLEVARGEVVGLVGANGAGKTTTVECILGLRRPDGGSLRVLGLDPVNDAARLRGLVGSQPQSAGLPDRLRVGEAVRLFSGRGSEELLEQFGLFERRRSAFASLSGGERQRLFLVLALVNRPPLVILDELTQGLDPAARRSVWTAIEQLRTDGTTVLLVTHELDEAEQLCDRVVAMRAGRVLDSGTPAELVDRYGSSATISFTLSADHDLEMLPRLDLLPGVSHVRERAGKVTVTGGRAAIAHVSASLVGTGWVPSDLSARVPSLEDALLSLLERDSDQITDIGEPALIGATR